MLIQLNTYLGTDSGLENFKISFRSICKYTAKKKIMGYEYIHCTYKYYKFDIKHNTSCYAVESICIYDLRT